MGLDDSRESYASKANSQSNTASAASKEAPADAKPKKMTWATIASQPVKTSQARVMTTLKKKPGMPPPPMIPGKHNMDIGTWVRFLVHYITTNCALLSNYLRFSRSGHIPTGFREKRRTRSTAGPIAAANHRRTIPISIPHKSE